MRFSNLLTKSVYAYIIYTYCFTIVFLDGMCNYKGRCIKLVKNGLMDAIMNVCAEMETREITSVTTGDDHFDLVEFN